MADIVNNVSLWVARPWTHAEGVKVTYLLYPRFTALDVVGTFQVLAAAPGIRSVFLAAEVGMVPDDTGLCALQAGARLRDVVSADVVVVPGSDCSLLTWQGDGHTAYGRSNERIRDAGDAYLIEGTLPPAGQRC